METTEHGLGSVLALPGVDVNENEESRGKPYGAQIDRSITKKSRPSLEDSVSKVRPVDDDSGQTGRKGYDVYIASSNGSVNVNVDSHCSVLPSQHVRVSGNEIMLDLVARSECLPVPNRMKNDGCVMSDQHRLNGFTESSVELMVGLGGSGGGVLRSCSDTAAAAAAARSALRPEEGNGMLLQNPLNLQGKEVRETLDPCSSSGQEETLDPCSSGQPNDGYYSQEEPRPPKPPPSSSLSRFSRTVVKHQCNCTTCTTSSSTGSDIINIMTNGDMMDSLSNTDDDTDDPDVLDTCYCSHLDTQPCQVLGSLVKEGGKVKVANGGFLHIVHENDSETCDFIIRNTTDNSTNVPFDVVVQHASSDQRPVINIRMSPSPESRDAHSGGLPAVCVISPEGGDRSETTSAKLPSSPCPPSTLSLSINTSPDSPMNTGGSSSTREEDSSESSLAARHHLTLRTPRTNNPNIAVSLSCDATPLGPPDGGLFFGGPEEEGGTTTDTFELSRRRRSAPDKLPEDGLVVLSDPSDPSDQGLITKKFGITDFFTRSLFSRKPKEPKPPSQNAPGWTLFGKSPSRENAAKDSEPIQQEDQATGGATASGPQAHFPAGRRKNLEFEPLSTTALILEDRPASLPAKSVEEAQRHRQEYDEMVAGAKRREMKEAQRKKRQMKERYKQEESIANAMVVWNTEILPNWESLRNTRRVRELWWQGLPPSVRGKVWSLAIGNELNITPELYEIFLSRAKERWKSFSETSSENETEDCGVSLADRESSLDLIKLDISRTFPSLFIFQKGGPYHDLLHSVLGAYTCYRPDVGYVQGMSFIAAVLILNLEVADAFIAFANLLNKPCQMAFFRVDHDLMLKYFAAFEVFFEENLPRLFNHFQVNNLTPDLYLIDWIFTLYSKSLPLDVACRVWDVFCRDGEECLFRTGLGILRLYQEVLLQMDFIHMAQFLTRLPDDMAPDPLFSCIAATCMVSSNRKWAQVFSALKDGNKEMDKNHSPALRS